MNGPHFPKGSETPTRPVDTPLQGLLVEDDPTDARLFEECLRKGPVEATLRHEETLQDGLQALEEKPPDVLVADLGPPDSESTETARAVAAAAPEVPIVVLTGSDDLQAALDAQEAGATEYLQKTELTPALVGRTLRWVVQRHRMQAQLRRRDAWIRSITERLSAGVFRADPSGEIAYANEALAKKLGFEHADALIGRDLTTFSTGPTHWDEMVGNEADSDVEVEFEGRSGSPFIGRISTKGAYDDHGAVLHYDGVITDVTDRVRRERRLRMLSEALEQTKQAILIAEADPLDKPGPRIVYANDAFETMTGYSEAEVLGKTPRILQGPETSRDELDSLREALEDGEEWSGETVNYRKSGAPYRVQWSVSPVRNANGDIEHWVSVQRDVTKRKKHERNLRRAKEEAERMNRLKSAFLANMSHEIRTPLTSILGFAEAIGEEVDEAQAADDVNLSTLDQFSSLIGRSGRRLMDTLTGVLNLSKLQAGEMTLDLEPVNLTREVKEAVVEFGPQAKKAGICLDVQTETSPVRARADEGGLQIVLRNLVSNAIKYTGEGGQVWIRVRREENGAVVEIEDTGIGMNPATVSGLFDAFKQASEGIERQYEGTGLGLTVTKEVLDRMNGSITVETEIGTGTLFTFRLPNVKTEELPSPLQAPSQVA